MGRMQITKQKEHMKYEILNTIDKKHGLPEHPMCEEKEYTLSEAKSRLREVRKVLPLVELLASLKGMNLDTEFPEDGLSIQFSIDNKPVGAYLISQKEAYCKECQEVSCECDEEDEEPEGEPLPWNGKNLQFFDKNISWVRPVGTNISMRALGIDQTGVIVVDRGSDGHDHITWNRLIEDFEWSEDRKTWTRFSATRQRA